MSKEAIDFFTSFLASNYSGWAITYCVKNGRMAFVEDAIVKNGELAAQYAERVIKGRWEEAEDSIAESPAALEYAKNVIKGRWSKLEKKILQNSRSGVKAIEYSLAIGERFPEAENMIAGCHFRYIFDYISGVVHGRFEPAEDKIIKSARSMLAYSKILGGRLPDHMHSAMVMLSFENPEDKKIKAYFNEEKV